MNESFDIIVVGSGAAGIAAAVAAARAGCDTLLLDSRPAAGGTGGFSGLTTLCGAYREDGRFLNDGFTREFAEALLREDGMSGPVLMGGLMVQLYRPESFRKIALEFLQDEPRISVRWGTRLRGVRVEAGRISSINGIGVEAVVDCTGIAAVGCAAGEELLETDERTQAPAVVFSLENVARDLSTPAAAVQVLLPLARAGFPPLSFLPSPDPGTLAVKFTGNPAQVPELVGFLRREVAGFERCRSPQTEFQRVERAGRMIAGRYILAGRDVLEARKFPDAVARGCWPIEQWSSEGHQRLRRLAAGEHYDIPAGALRARRNKNLFMAGKSLSADVDAVASARVMGCCLATGEAAGRLAAAFVNSESKHQRSEHPIRLGASEARAP